MEGMTAVGRYILSKAWLGASFSRLSCKCRVIEQVGRSACCRESDLPIVGAVISYEPHDGVPIAVSCKFIPVGGNRNVEGAVKQAPSLQLVAPPSSV